MHLADVPRLVRRGHGDLDFFLETMPMDGVDVVHPDGHPDALVARLAAAQAALAGGGAISRDK
jgi:hypothetical protein